ncbi:Omp28-related outer membrane protein [bacterium]|nr:Omp28-related outer membrane protein [bacterium]
MRTLFLLSVFVLFALLPAQQVDAQARRIAFYEHFTNASCGPCASQNPVFKSTIMDNNKGNYIHMAYHTVWPGRDPMNAYNKDEVDTRVRFYGVSGVPTMVLQGDEYQGSPVGVSQEIMNRVIATSSPLRIIVTEGSDGSTRTVHAKLTTVGQMPTAGLRVRAAVLEKEITYASAPGSNGEKEFPNVFRNFLNSATGEDFTPAAIGESVDLSWTYDLANAEWDTTKIAAVVWVQNESNKEVYNAGAAFLPMVELVMDDQTFKKGTPQNATTFNARIENLGSDAADLHLAFTGTYPADWSVEYEMDGNTYTDEADIAVPGNSSTDITFTVTVGDDPGIGDYMMTMTSLDDSELSPQMLGFGVISGVTDMVINNDNSWGAEGEHTTKDFEYVYLDGLDAAGSTTHASTSLSTFMRAFDAGMLNDVRHLYFNVGWTFPALPDEFSRAMLGFLGEGGNLMVGGQDIGWDVFDPDNGHGTSAARAFYRTYMFANWSADGDGSNSSVSFQAEDPLFGNVPSSDLENVYGKSSQGVEYFYPDVIRPTPEGVVVAFYNGDTEKGAAIRGAKNDFKTVYFGFALEQVKDAAVRNELVKLTWQWFHGVISSVQYDAAVASLSLGQNYPNPASAQTVIPLTAGTHERQLRVYDQMGRLVDARTVSAGTTQLQLNTTGYRPGVYYYQLFDGSQLTGSRVMQVLR